MTISCSINTSNLDAIIDTGADKSLLSCEFYKSNNLGELSCSNVQLYTITGGGTEVIGEMMANLRIGRTNYSHPLVVANIVDDLVLGADFLKLYRAKLDLASGILELDGKEMKIRETHRTRVVRMDPNQSLVELPVPLAEMMDRSYINLDPNQAIQVQQLVTENLDIFSKDSAMFGRTDLVKHKIELTDEHPIKQPHRRLPLVKMREMDSMVEEMLSKNVIEPSDSPWASPVVLVQKKDGSRRFCVDYRRLNEITIKDSFPLPRIDDTLLALSGSKWYSTLDLQSGFWQVEMDPKDKQKTAFTTGTGLYHFNVMPFGLCNAPATFERLMQKVLQGLTNDKVMVYLDDVLVLGKSFEDQMENLKLVIERIRKANLTLNPKKCQLFNTKVKYLGHMISGDGIETDPDKTESIRTWPQPTNKTELRSFLGLATYYRKFVKHFSSIAQQLHKLTEADVTFEWSSKCEEAFKTLKEKLTSSPILAYPEIDKPYILDTDASNAGVGAVLSQVQDGQERVVAYFSKTLNRAERNYCTTRKELLAIVKAVSHFHCYIYGQEVIVRTDHGALTWLLSFKNVEGQMARWLERLSQYQLSIKHRPGRVHNNADGLSRRPCSECQHCEKLDSNKAAIRLTGMVSEILDYAIIEKEQKEDDELKEVIKWVREEKRPEWEQVSHLSRRIKTYWGMFKSLTLEEEVLCRKWQDARGEKITNQPVVPNSLVPVVLKEYHNTPCAGHFGVSRTLNRIRKQYFWVYCRDDVEKWCRECNTCNARRGPTRKTQGQLQVYAAGEPFQRLAVDILGPLPASNKNNKYILVVMDYFTKWVEAFALPDQKAETTAEALVNGVISRFGVPIEIHSDQGRNFESEVFTKSLEILGIHKTRTTPLHPQSDGLVERMNRTILNYLAKFVDENQRNWDDVLPLFLLAYRSVPQESTKITPASLVFGRELRLPMDLVNGRPPDQPNQNQVEYLWELKEKLEKAHEFARKNMINATTSMKTRYDRKQNHLHFEEGSFVWLYNPKRTVGKSPKLQSNWEGPFKVINQITDVTLRIQKKKRAKPKIVHIDRLASYINADAEDLYSS